nr:DNA polymerase IV [Desulfuromonadales bacterium]
MAARIRQTVRERTGLTVSVGIAGNKFLAKMASGRAKPDGIFEIAPHAVEGFLHPLAVDQLWGIGRVGASRLEKMGIVRVADILRLDTQRLKTILGAKLGEKIWHLARGIDDREVEAHTGEQSIGTERTFSTDLYTLDDAHKALLDLAEEVGRRVRAGGRRGRCVTLKVRHADFTTVTRSQTQAPGLRSTAAIYRVAIELLGKTEVGTRPVRLLGITLSLLDKENEGQVELFDDRSEDRMDKVDGAVDALRRRFGDKGVVRGTLLDSGSED